jgi:hypothetical protein
MRNVRGLAARIALLSCVAVGPLCASEAQGKSVYRYSGLAYTYSYPATKTCLTPGMYLTMALTFSAPLPPNLNNQVVQAVSWVIDDGKHTFKDTAKKAIAPLQSTFSTDGSGNITSWLVNSYYYAKDGITILYSTHSSNAGDYSDDANCKVPNIADNTTPGTWKH